VLARDHASFVKFRGICAHSWVWKTTRADARALRRRLCFFGVTFFQFLCWFLSRLVFRCEVDRSSVSALCTRLIPCLIPCRCPQKCPPSRRPRADEQRRWPGSCPTRCARRRVSALIRLACPSMLAGRTSRFPPLLGETECSSITGCRPVQSLWTTRSHGSTKRCCLPSRRCAAHPDLHPCCASCRQIDVIKYTEEEYKQHLSDDSSWSREHTDRLFDAARRYDLRWPVILDRLDFGAAHTLPDMKARFYNVTARIIAARCELGCVRVCECVSV
jgi:hypothetical protein